MSPRPRASDRRAPRRFGLLVAGLLAVDAAAAAAVWHVMTTPLDVSPVVVADAAGSLPVPGADTAQGGLIRSPPPASAKLAGTLARPLFRADRRPPAPPVAMASSEPSGETAPPAVTEPIEKPVDAAPPPLPEGLRLVGVARLPAGRPRALLRVKAASGGTWMSAGETLAGWRIAEIGHDDVWLEAEGQRHLLSLDPRRALAQAQAATQPVK